MQSLRSFFFLFPSIVVLSVSCVSTGKYKAMQQQATQNDSLYNQSMRTLQACQNDNKLLEKQKATLQDQANDVKLQLTATQENNSVLRKEIQSISAISASQAESIKKSLDRMGSSDTYMMALHDAVSRRDSANLALVIELKATVGGYAAQGLSIQLQNGTVYVDLTDSLLFGGDTTSYSVTDASKPILQRLARVLNDQPSVQFVIEGHTDSLTDAQDSLIDSWDLSVKRATSIARLLQKQYKVSPTRITAAGRGEYAAVAATDSLEALTANRRTRFIFLPAMDQVLRLLDHRQGQSQDQPAASAPATQQQTPPQQTPPQETAPQQTTPPATQTAAPPTNSPQSN